MASGGWWAGGESLRETDAAGECGGVCAGEDLCGARQRADAPGGGGADALCGDLCGAEYSAGLVSVWREASGDLSQGGLHGVWVRDLCGGGEEVFAVDFGGGGCGGG